MPLSALTDDLDGDGLSDTDEQTYGADPFDADSDDDGLEDGIEVHAHGTNPNAADSDGDSYSDPYELEHGADPLDPQSVPGAVVPVAAAWGYAALAALLAATALRVRSRARTS